MINNPIHCRSTNSYLFSNFFAVEPIALAASNPLFFNHKSAKMNNFYKFDNIYISYVSKRRTK